MGCEYFPVLRLLFWGNWVKTNLVCLNRGLKLADAGKTFILGYAVMVGAVVIIMMPIYFLIWRCTRAKKDKKEEQELENIYSHSYQEYHR